MNQARSTVSLTKLTNTLYYYDVHVDGDSPKEPVEPDSKVW